MLAEMASEPGYDRTTYVGPTRGEQRAAPPSSAPADRETVAAVTLVGESDTGMVLFWRGDEALAIVPPFPMEARPTTPGPDVAQLATVLEREPMVGVALVRLGRYAVGVLRGETLLAAKSGTRYVKGRHRAGGSSQRRFQRSRERQVRELYDAACRTAQEVLEPWEKKLDYLIMGGERHTLLGFERRCALLRRLSPIRLSRTLDVERPGRKALEEVGDQLWQSRVVVLARGED